MKTLLVVAAVAILATSNPSEAAMIKCPQADGSVLSVPESMGCSTRSERAQQEAEQAAASRRREAERETEARQQQGAEFVRASEACTQQANRYKFYPKGPEFKAVAKTDGKVRMLGSAQDRFDYQTCMDKQGHPLESK